MLGRVMRKRLVVRLDDKVTAMQHPGETRTMFAVRCNRTAHHIMGKA